MNQAERKRVMEHIYTALVERGYCPMDQIIGYILMDDPTYITKHKEARRMIANIDRHNLLCDLLSGYFSTEIGGMC